jgi:hypothetical protein
MRDGLGGLRKFGVIGPSTNTIVCSAKVTSRKRSMIARVAAARTEVDCRMMRDPR